VALPTRRTTPEFFPKPSGKGMFQFPFCAFFLDRLIRLCAQDWHAYLLFLDLFHLTKRPYNFRVSSAASGGPGGSFGLLVSGFEGNCGSGIITLCFSEL